ncbi:FbpB family small basic protein [Oceanobacillus sp. FSL H7-0719]|uniref:FbpB family small basic protein n=1 Tax=Oceanobacillus sp. FSL H7-0719 TaxID=2954507 RepID=UPI00324E3EC4
MRPKRLNFEQLVNQNIKDLLDDENSLNQLELRLEKKHEVNSRKQRERHAELFSNEG